MLAAPPPINDEKGTRLRPTAATTKADDGTDARIRAVFTRLEDAFHAHDADAFDDQFTEDAIQVNAAGQRLVGWNVLHRFHKERLESHATGLRVALHVESIKLLAPDVAIVHTIQETHASDAVRRNAGTWVLVERGDSWWIQAAQQTNVAELVNA